ncbi:zf-PARP-domain-containing protein [Polyplosphaeria fusca]|uniref:Zf-PARP-domain-containing protein n=1 Tax=Polyplosphaeria fusca TaxID=682080 RepID=A0A9P4QM74_9PLEO|nr:zf-PARP-domain-containing protein [Polyplosphaeria fusca]
MPYRFELASAARAGCNNKECKDAKVKIQKDELRMGTMVTIMDHQSWQWRHWGCITPLQLANIQEDSGGDTDLIDGYDELPSEWQTKIKTAIDNGHVPDEDWKGDVEVNRPGMKGFRVKAKATPKKKKAAKIADEAEEKPKKKRGRANDEDDAAPAPKKTKGRAKKAQEEVVVEAADEEAEPEPKKTRGKRAAKKEVVYEEPEDEAEVEAPKPKRGKKKTAVADEEKAAPQKKGRKKKAVVEED